MRSALFHRARPNTESSVSELLAGHQANIVLEEGEHQKVWVAPFFEGRPKTVI